MTPTRPRLLVVLAVVGAVPSGAGGQGHTKVHQAGLRAGLEGRRELEQVRHEQGDREADGDDQPDVQVTSP